MSAMLSLDPPAYTHQQILSATILKQSYHHVQYISAVIVMAGIFTVLAPSLFGGSDDGGGNTLLWGVVLIASCIPMCLSSIYKEVKETAAAVCAGRKHR